MLSTTTQLLELDPDTVIISSCNLRRNHLEEKQVNQMIAALRNGQDLGPIQVRNEDNQWAVIDGQHRLTAYQRFARQTDRQIKIKAIIRNVSDDDARKISFGSNEGRGWSEQDLMRIFYEAYDSGMTISKIAQEFQRSESKITEYIKFWIFLHASLRQLISSRGDATKINLMSAKLLCKTTPDVQVLIYQAALEQGVHLKSYIDLCYRDPTFPRVKDDIKPYFGKRSIQTPIIVQPSIKSDEPLIDLSSNKLTEIPESISSQAVHEECLARLNSLKNYAIANDCLPFAMAAYQRLFNETL